MTHFVGLDVSQKMTTVCVVDDSGRGLWRGQCPSVPEQINALVRRHAGDDARIGIETGAMTPWLVSAISGSKSFVSMPGMQDADQQDRSERRGRDWLRSFALAGTGPFICGHPIIAVGDSRR